MSVQEEIAGLRAELSQAVAVIVALRAENEARRQRITELEQRKTPPPSFVKPNRLQKADMAGRVRRVRAAVHNPGRRRGTPTRVERHAYEACPDCGYALQGESIKRTREVIEIPALTAAVIEHRFIKRHCPVCKAWKTPPATVIDGQMLGQGRIGVRLASLIGTLRTTHRLPLAHIQALLDQVCGVRISHGGLQECLATLAQTLAPVRTQITDQTRASPVQHMDETGMRENGQNGYVWTQATGGDQPTWVLTYNRSRAGQVARDLLGDYDGVLTTDFYAAYDTCGLTRQRCWAHLARDLHALREEHPDRQDVWDWCTAVLAVKTKALALDTTTLTLSARAHQATTLERQTHDLARCYWKDSAHPAHNLAKRLYRYEGELFTFVRVPAVPATNNLAERSIRLDSDT